MQHLQKTLRLTTAAGHVLEFNQLEDMLKALEWLEARGGGVPSANPDQRVGRVAAGPVTAVKVLDPVERFARSDGQRRFLQALIASEVPLTDDALATSLGIDKTKVQGTMGAIFARAAEQGIIATEIVHRERKKSAAGRRYYEYSAGPLLRSETGRPGRSV
jgi:hypothetical protein